MKNMWQLPEEKTDKKLSMEAVLRELEEETGLIIEPEDLKFLLNNPNYNCDIYILKVYPNTELDLMKSEKNEEWEKFSFKAYERMAREGCIIPNYITCIELILHKIKLKDQNPQEKSHKATLIKKDLAVIKIRWKSKRSPHDGNGWRGQVSKL